MAASKAKLARIEDWKEALEHPQAESAAEAEDGCRRMFQIALLDVGPAVYEHQLALERGSTSTEDWEVVDDKWQQAVLSIDDVIDVCQHSVPGSTEIGLARAALVRMLVGSARTEKARMEFTKLLIEFPDQARTVESCLESDWVADEKERVASLDTNVYVGEPTVSGIPACDRLYRAGVCSARAYQRRSAIDFWLDAAARAGRNAKDASPQKKAAMATACETMWDETADGQGKGTWCFFEDYPGLTLEEASD